jgi:hypothetical protein
MGGGEDKYLDTERQIDEGLVILISRINILALMAEGLENIDLRAGMALSEVSRQLDQQARQLLDDWETYIARQRNESGDAPEAPAPSAGRAAIKAAHGVPSAKRDA